MSKKKKNSKTYSKKFTTKIQIEHILKNLQKTIDKSVITLEEGMKELAHLFKNSSESTKTSSKDASTKIDKPTTDLLDKKTSEGAVEEKITQPTENNETKVIEPDSNSSDKNGDSSNIDNSNINYPYYPDLNELISSEELDISIEDELSSPTLLDEVVAFFISLKSSIETLFEQYNPFTQINFTIPDTQELFNSIFYSAEEEEYYTDENMPGESNTPNDFV